MIVALYARVSTAKQAEMDLSIPDQVRQVKEWCAREGHSVAVEYKEPGASATDDRRPVFQQMIAEACEEPPPFEAVVVHSLSRFFRDSYEFAFYERQLHKAGVKLISTTQQTGEDLSGMIARKFFNIMDEYSSLENAKHTLRAMNENARQRGSTTDQERLTGSMPSIRRLLPIEAGSGKNWWSILRRRKSSARFMIFT